MTKRLITIALSIACLMMAALCAQAQQQRPYRGTYTSVRQTILRLENRANLFRNAIEDWSAQANPTYTSTEDINFTTRDFNDTVRRLRDRFDRRQATSSDVQDVLNHANRIDDFVSRSTLDARAQNLWSSIRSDLSELAQAYNLSWQTSGY